MGALGQVMSMHRLDGQCRPAGRGMSCFGGEEASVMSASLRSPEPVGAREPVSGSGQVTVSRGPVVHRRRGRLVLIDSGEPAEQVALRGGLEQSGGRAAAPGSGVAERDRCSHSGPGSPCSPCGTKERAERAVLEVGAERSGVLVLSSRLSLIHI